MRSPAVPLALLLVVAGATFGLAQWHPFSPASEAASASIGNVAEGRAVFATTCAGCHGDGGSGGVGPRLAGSRLTADEVRTVVASGRGVMPAGLVDGQSAADVAAYVASIAQ